MICLLLKSKKENGKKNEKGLSLVVGERNVKILERRGRRKGYSAFKRFTVFLIY
jgi:hypothetical protein